MSSINKRENYISICHTREGSDVLDVFWAMGSLEVVSLTSSRNTANMFSESTSAFKDLIAA